VALLGAALTVVGVDAQPAGAATSTVSVSPSTGLRDGDTVAVTVSGADFASHSLAQCDAAWLTDTTNPYPDTAGLLSHCNLAADNVRFTAEPGSTTTVDMVVRESFRNGGVGSETITCGDAPDDCIIVDLDHTSGQWPDEAGGYAPISMERTPTLAVSPMPAWSSPWTVTVTGTLFRREPVTVAQCSTTWAESPDPATADASCGAPLTLTPDAAGGFSATMTLTDPVVARDGGTIPCGLDGCRVVAGYADEPVRVAAVAWFAVPTFTASPTTDLESNTTTHVTIAGVRDTSALVRLCMDIPPGGDLPGGRFCFPTYDQTVPLADDGTGEIDFPVRDGRYADMFMMRTFDCRGGGCYLAAFTSTGQQIDESIPVTYRPDPFITLGTSAQGWDEGTVAQLHGEYLPAPLWQIDVCNLSATSCEPPTTAWGRGAGPFTLDTTVTLTQAPGDTAVCRGSCIVRARPYLFSGPTLTTTYSAQSPSVAVAPATGLTAGQSVVVTGTGMMKPYQGRPLYLPTGGWSVSLCDGSVPATAPALGEVLTKCTVPPGGSPVTVTDHTSVNTVTVPAQFTASLGGATFDCTRSPGACKLGLVRWEQDATVTARFQPLTFATG
jgi:Neocarzinostatin family